MRYSYRVLVDTHDMRDGTCQRIAGLIRRALHYVFGRSVHVEIDPNPLADPKDRFEFDEFMRQHGMT